MTSNSLSEKFMNAVSKYDMLSDNDIVIVGLSGGADSVALLYALLSVKERYSINIRACHIDHHLRGEESDADERYVRELCERLGVELDVIDIDVKASARKHESTEETARKLRYEHFARLCEKYGAKLATAHTATDNAETVLMNMIRGTGTKGLAGIPAVRENIIRPLIFCTREDTEEYCRENNVHFVTDSTNLTDDYTRNRIRHKVLPLLKEFNPSFIDTVSRMTVTVSDDSAFLEEYSGQQAELCGSCGRYDVRKLSPLPLPIKSRIVRNELKNNDIEPSALRIAQCIEIIDKGLGKVNLCKNKFAYVRKKLFFIKHEEQLYRQH